MSKELKFELGPLGPSEAEQLKEKHWLVSINGRSPVPLNQEIKEVVISSTSRKLEFTAGKLELTAEQLKELNLQISVNGADPQPLAEGIRVVKISSDFGVLAVGRRPDGGYPGWAYAEEGGGGSLTIPFAFTPAGEILLGLALEERQNLGGATWCGIGGFAKPGQSHAGAQKQTMCQKTYICSEEAFPLEGEPGTSNRQFFVVDIKNGKGLHWFALEIPYEDLEYDKNEDNWSIKAGALTGYKKPENVRLFRFEKAVQTPDVFFMSAAARLVAQLGLLKKNNERAELQ